MEALTIPVTIYVLATTNPFLPTSYHASTCDMSQQFPVDTFSFRPKRWNSPFHR
jgi:hypothetical protein